jgi:hypothetical protein
MEPTRSSRGDSEKECNHMEIDPDTLSKKSRQFKFEGNELDDYSFLNEYPPASKRIKSLKRIKKSKSYT